jgi:septal ring factor EnvC (AmiA/AmiB activator)
MTHCPRCGKDNAAEIHSCTPTPGSELAQLYEQNAQLREQNTELDAKLAETTDALKGLEVENDGLGDRIKSLYKQLNTTEKEVDDLRLLLRQALEALEYIVKPPCMCWAGCDDCDPTKAPDVNATIAAIKERLG